MEALKERQSIRAFSTKPLPDQVVADLLWAAFGINRPDSGKRTAPSARNWQEVDVYAVMDNGACLYDATSIAVISNASPAHAHPMQQTPTTTTHDLMTHLPAQRP